MPYPVPCRCGERGTAPAAGKASLGLAAGRSCCRHGHVSVAGLVGTQLGCSWEAVGMQQGWTEDEVRMHWGCKEAAVGMQ